MERTISIMNGEGSLNHNNRTFTADNVDSSRTALNITFINDNIKTVYHELFDQALKSYNNKQTRKDRQIKNYYEKISRSKQEKTFHEIVIQIGNKDDMNARDWKGETARDILSEYYHGFQKRNSNLRVFNAVIHMDEETPHLHVDYVPFVTESSRGLATRVSLKGALAKQGFVGSSRQDTEWYRWVEAEKGELAAVMERYGVKWKQLGTHNQHLSVYDYKKQERIKEVEALEKQVDSTEEEFLKTNKLLGKSKHELENLETIKTIALLENEALVDKNNQLNKDFEAINAKFMLMSEAVASVDSIMYEIDNGREYQLEQPTALMSAKNYKEKLVDPFIKKLKQLVRTVYNKYADLKVKIRRMEFEMETISENVADLRKQIKEKDACISTLQVKADNFDKIAEYLTPEQIDEMIKAVEEIRRMQKQHREINKYYEEWKKSR